MKLNLAAKIMEQAMINQLDMIKAGTPERSCVPYLESSPGIGKTTVTIQTTKNSQPLLDRWESILGEKPEPKTAILSLGQYDAGELAGWTIPAKNNEEMIRLRPDWMPKDGCGTIFIDELPAAPTACQNIAAQLVNERRVGSHSIPDGWVIVAAGNLSTDRAGTNTMPTHLRDRLMYLTIEADLDETVAYFNMQGVDFRIPSYLRFRPEFLHKFDPMAKACPSPRSWMKTSSILKWDLSEMGLQEAIRGQVGDSAAADFMGYLRLYKSCPDIDELIRKPDQAAIPSEPDVVFAIAAALSARMNTDNTKNILRYMKRLPEQELTAFLIKDAVNRDNSLRDLPAIHEWILGIGDEIVTWNYG